MYKRPNESYIKIMSKKNRIKITFKNYNFFLNCVTIVLRNLGNTKRQEDMPKKKTIKEKKNKQKIQPK